jgi:formylglycine-generating enzyme required for sulfatase activity
MKTKTTLRQSTLIAMFLLFVSTQSFGLNYTIIFTASGATTIVGSVEVKNLTKGTAVTVPNGNTLTLTDVTTAMDLQSVDERNLNIIQNANTGISTIKFYATQSGNTQVTAYNIDGRKIVGQNIILEEGVNALDLTLPKGVFVVCVTGQGYNYTSKLLNPVSKNLIAGIKFLSNSKIEVIKIQRSKSTPIQTTNMTYTTGDQLLYTATSATFVASVPDVPTGGKIVDFYFAAIPTSAIPAGTFVMGSPVTEIDRGGGEVMHQVTLDAFYISKYEVTNAQYAAFLNVKNIGSNGKFVTLPPYPTRTYIFSNNSWGLIYNGTQWIAVAGYENHPVIDVTWYGAIEYANYLGGTLPTEAQWEYACRAGTTTPFYTGNFLTNIQANYDWTTPYNNGTNTVNTSLNKTQNVGIYYPNTWGLYDMHGNVSELCYDWFGGLPSTPQTNPYGANSGSCRVIRGGSWSSFALDCRSSSRNCASPDYITSIPDVGFRVVFAP